MTSTIIHHFSAFLTFFGGGGVSWIVDADLIWTMLLRGLDFSIVLIFFKRSVPYKNLGKTPNLKIKVYIFPIIYTKSYKLY